jgi:hypothetical protein
MSDEILRIVISGFSHPYLNKHNPNILIHLQQNPRRGNRLGFLFCQKENPNENRSGS